MLNLLRNKPYRGVAAVAAAGAAYTGFLAEDAFEVVSATLGETAVMVFVAPRGAAAAVEVTERGAQVLTGLAAGAVLAEVEEADEAVRSTERADAGATAAVIEAMIGLSAEQKARLRGALSL
jgi:hypothetical protein